MKNHRQNVDVKKKISKKNLKPNFFCLNVKFIFILSYKIQSSYCITNFVLNSIFIFKLKINLIL